MVCLLLIDWCCMVCFLFCYCLCVRAVFVLMLVHFVCEILCGRVCDGVPFVSVCECVW